LSMSISPSRLKNTTAITTRPVEWPRPQRMPREKALQEEPTDKVARAER